MAVVIFDRFSVKIGAAESCRKTFRRLRLFFSSREVETSRCAVFTDITTSSRRRKWDIHGKSIEYKPNRVKYNITYS